MKFNKESDFEEALIKLLFEKGWEHQVLKNPTEQDLLDNWASILFDNNRGKDRLNNCPLTESEMQQIVNQIKTLRTPLKLNGFINGKTVSVKRDNPDDLLHLGKEVSLKIYDRQEIAAGQSRYQIVQQPKFPTQGILNNRRGDVMLLINGMPVFHIELKKSGIPVSQAAHQIEKYAREGIFSGLFALVQIFVAMNPEETVYFANPGPDGKFNSDFYFHWADFDNERLNDWKDIASTLLSIPMAHQLIGFYTVADASDGVLKVMRSYQYYAANAISDRVSKTKWDGDNLRGGYIWHTTGSGKTMTSFKSAQLIANSKDADKVIFLIDRIELGTQSLKEYRGFAEENEEVQATENTNVLISKLKSNNPADTLIVTSIQKMSNIKDESGMNAADIQKMTGKRIVFIVDECHRSTFGSMLTNIKNTFSRAIFFGFTGTPIMNENEKKDSTTATIFGNELHRYSIADGIRDKNVLGFDPYKVMTYKDKDLRKAVALHQAKAANEDEVYADPAKKEIYDRIMSPYQTPMASRRDNKGKPIKGIEDYLPKSQYTRDDHRYKVVEDIHDNWKTLSHNGKFHAIFTTISIPEAIRYYRIFKRKMPKLNVTALFDPNIDNGKGATTEFKENGLVEIITDYNAKYEQNFDLGSHGKFKKDIAARLAHKDPYRLIERTPEQQINLLIVVSQMLTGFDSKWINTLYVDKLLAYEEAIQAFSRTNRLFGPEKPFGTIRYYCKPHTMDRNIAEAVKLYSGDKPLGLFVDKLKDNLVKMNELYRAIHQVFKSAGITGFIKNPSDTAACAQFAKLFKQLSDRLEAAKIQGFQWSKAKYELSHALGTPGVAMEFNEAIYLTLALRYKELFAGGSGDGTSGNDDVPFEIDGYLTEINTDKIDTDYMNSRFEKYLKLMNINPKPSKELIEQALNELHQTFATLTQEEQKYAYIILHDIERGDLVVEKGVTLRDEIVKYQVRAENDRIRSVVEVLGVDGEKLYQMMRLNLTENNLNEFGRFSQLKETVDKAKAQKYFEKEMNVKLTPAKVNMHIDSFLRNFLLMNDNKK
jgi:type I restriction enzyme R subunit